MVSRLTIRVELIQHTSGIKYSKRLNSSNEHEMTSRISYFIIKEF